VCMCVCMCVRVCVCVCVCVCVNINLTATLPQDGTCQWFRSDGSRLSCAEYSYGKLHGTQTWYKADGCSVDYVEKYWNGARMRADGDHVAAGGGSAASGSGAVRWTEIEREQVKVTR
jgi:hypothetical protein